MVRLTKFTTKNGKEIPVIEITEVGWHYPIRLGLPKINSILRHREEIEKILQEFSESKSA